MTNQQMLHVAMEQSAVEMNCIPEDFVTHDNKITNVKQSEKARSYFPKEIAGNLVSYGTNIVATCKPELTDVVNEYINKYNIEHCFETPNIYALNEKIAKYDLMACYMSEYFLLDMTNFEPRKCAYEMKVLGPDDFVDLYKEEWSNALCEDRKQLDVLGVGAYDKGKLIGLAGCSADCESMWQIGIDVLPEYRRQGIASALHQI